MTNDDSMRLARLEQGQEALRQDIAGMKGDVSGLKGDVSGLKEDVSSLKSDVGRLKDDMAEIKTTLSSLVPMIVRIDQRLADMPQPAEFYELRGRVEEISRRLPTTLAYVPPPGKAERG